MARLIASIQQLSVEGTVLALPFDRLLEKNAKATHLPTWNCLSILPTSKSEAPVVNLVGELCNRRVKRVTLARMFWLDWMTCTASGIQMMKLLGF